MASPNDLNRRVPLDLTAYPFQATNRIVQDGMWQVFRPIPPIVGDFPGDAAYVNDLSSPRDCRSLGLVPTMVTVGLRYAHEPHPWGLHPDGWLTVWHSPELEVRDIVLRLVGRAFAFDYPEDRFKPEYHPHGEQRWVAYVS